MSDLAWQAGQIAYCTNVHPGESLAEIKANLLGPVAGVRQARGLDSMEIGLWLSQQAVHELKKGNQLAEFKHLLSNLGLAVRSLNGFPFGGFHQTQQKAVKTQVYQPDWSERKRLQYSLDLVDVAAELLPAGAAYASISTLPLVYRTQDVWSTRQISRAISHLTQLTAYCAEVHQRTGKRVVYALEMEPDCALGFVTDALDFFAQYQATDSHHDYLGICLDVCHQAVQFESVVETLSQLHRAGIQVSKIQLSNALSFQLAPADLPSALRNGFAKRLCDSPWLHQTRLRLPEHIILLRDFKYLANGIPVVDPHQALETRVHCHLPLFLDQVTLSDSIQAGTTQAELLAVLQALDSLYATGDDLPILEVETYSWSLVQADIEHDLVPGIAQELAWVEQQLGIREAT